MSYSVPILLVGFNRPDHMKQVLEVIKLQKPKKLFVSIDGPRKDRPDDTKRCDKVKDLFDDLEWECELHTRFLDENRGCKKAVSSAITWFFENVEEGIILEDDCVVDQSFFTYCEQMLDRYRDDTRVMGITGFNSQNGIKRGEASYYFSKIMAVWGWATWKRAWQHMDIDLATFPEFLAQNRINDVFQDSLSRKFWLHKLQDVQNGGNSWAFPWAYSIMTNNGLCVTPNVNLVMNIGFGIDATHATNHKSSFSNMKRGKLENIIHPKFVIPDIKADGYTIKVASQEQYNFITRFRINTKKFIKLLVGENFYSFLYKIVKKYT